MRIKGSEFNQYRAFNLKTLQMKTMKDNYSQPNKLLIIGLIISAVIIISLNIFINFFS